MNVSPVLRFLRYMFFEQSKLFDSIVTHFSFLFPDKIYLSLRYRCLMGRWINWSEPIQYQEKIQWLKLYDRKDYYTNMVDKIEAKKYVSSIIGSQYIIPTLGVWNSFEEIDFDSLPDKFVLKTNNGGGNNGVIVCTDKNNFDRGWAKNVLNKALKLSIYEKYREWPYKNIKPKIFAEVYMSDDSEFNRGGIADYKFTCFNGVVDNVMVCVERQTNDPKFYFFDHSWNLLPLNNRGKKTDPLFKLPKPDCMDEMFKLAAKLSENIPFLRVDLYCINNRPYFGETTFYPASGFDSNILPETEILFGEKIILPKITNK